MYHLPSMESELNVQLHEKANKMIELLTEIVEEQGKRIQQLEKTVVNLQHPPKTEKPNGK